MYVLHCIMNMWLIGGSLPKQLEVTLLDFVLLGNTSSLSSPHEGKMLLRCRPTGFRLVIFSNTASTLFSPLLLWPQLHVLDLFLFLCVSSALFSVFRPFLCASVLPPLHCKVRETGCYGSEPLTDTVGTVENLPKAAEHTLCIALWRLLRPSPRNFQSRTLRQKEGEYWVRGIGRQSGNNRRRLGRREDI